jgi:hypothetical protein
MTGEPSTIIHMNPVDVELFKEFCQHYDSFKTLLDSQVFDIRNGSATLSFKDTILMDIDVHLRTYKRGLSTAP